MKNNEVKFLGENLYQFRKEKGISQEELAGIIGVSRQAVYKWESGERMPDINNLVALCEEFDKSIDDFVEGADVLFKNKVNNIIENKETISTKKNKNWKEIIKIILIALALIYVLSVIIKASFFNIMYGKVLKYKDSNNYSYSLKQNYNQSRYSSEMGEVITITKKLDGVQRQTGYSDMNCSDVWVYTEAENKASYGMHMTFLEDETTNIVYTYSEGFSYPHSSPYELIEMIASQYYNLETILNPFKMLKIDFKNKDLIFESNDKTGEVDNTNYINMVYYIDLKTGLLSMIEIYELNELMTRNIYYNYYFDGTLDYEVNLSDENKKEIKEKAKNNVIDSINPNENVYTKYNIER